MPVLLRLAALAGLLALGGCALYVPTVPSTPLLRKGQVQVAGGIRNLVSLEGGAAWAPTQHLLLSAEGAYQDGGNTTTTDANNLTTSYHDFHRQLGLGAGYYRAAAAPTGWYLAALGGVGWASTSLHAVDYGWFLILPVPHNAGDYAARYRRYYGQVYAARPVARLLTAGGSLRSTWVDYTTLTLDGQPIQATTHLFIEPTAFLKIGNGPFQGQATLGLSMPWQRDSTSPLSRRTSPTSSLLSVSVIFRPDLLKHRQ